MIALPNKDRTFFDLPLRVADIIKEFQTTGKVIINTNSEGICLTSSKLYEILDYVCVQFSIDKSNITIQTCNIEETHSEYTIEILGDHWIDKSKLQLLKNWAPKDSRLYHIGCFIGKPNWHRLIISSWLHNFSNRVLQTMHYDPTSERHRIDAELTEINVRAPAELEQVVNFLNKCPLTLDEGFINYTIGPPQHYNIADMYNKIFLDLVIETYVSGLSFFPTEKTLRPIIALTPFIVMGPRGYLSNLKRIGFRTFDQWWDESYDNFSDYQRVQQIQTVVASILEWPQEKLSLVLDEMKPVLLHNKEILKKISGDSIKLNGQE